MNNNIKLIGTTHLDSKEKIKKLLDKEEPEIIGVELCELREDNIFKEVKSSNSNSLLSRITNAIKSKAEESNLDYGADMKATLLYAKENKIPYSLVDLPILKTQELFQKIPREEQEGFSKELIEFNEVEITDDIKSDEVIENMKERYPIAFEFLINMRNLYIANNILKLQRDNPNKRIVVVLGKAHINSVSKLIR